MKVKLERPWRRWKAGEVVGTLPDGVAELLIRRGTATRVEAEPAGADARTSRADMAGYEATARGARETRAPRRGGR